MKKREMSELCKVRGEGGKERESSSFSINYCREHESDPLWGSDNERTWGKKRFINWRISCSWAISGIKVLIGLLNKISLYSSICSGFLKGLTRGA